MKKENLFKSLKLCKRELQKKVPVMLEGDYTSWDKAMKIIGDIGYDDDTIIKKVSMATNDVIEGHALFERDGMLFYEQSYEYPLLASLYYIKDNLKKNKINVVDFGGGLGSSYFQHRQVLNNEFAWHIVEQKSFVDMGRGKVPNIDFFYDIDELYSSNKQLDVLLMSATINYFDNPWKYLSKLMSFNFEYIIIDRTLFNENDSNRLCIQTIRPPMYKAAYPCWLISKRQFMELCNENKYVQTFSWENPKEYMLLKENIFWKEFYVEGMMLQKHNNS